jgi:hypothetical protein
MIDHIKHDLAVMVVCILTALAHPWDFIADLLGLP